MTPIEIFTVAAAAALGAPPSADTAALADAVVIVADERPILGKDPRQTAALLLVTAWQESRFDPRATGDSGRSCGLFGIWVGARRERCALMAADPIGSARMARDLLAESLNVCKRMPVNERLGLFMGGACDRGLVASRHRWWWWRRLTEGLREEASS